MPWKEHQLKGLLFKCQLFTPHLETLASLWSLSDPWFLLLNNGEDHTTTDVD